MTHIRVGPEHVFKLSAISKHKRSQNVSPLVNGSVENNALFKVTLSHISINLCRSSSMSQIFLFSSRTYPCMTHQIL